MGFFQFPRSVPFNHISYCEKKYRGGFCQAVTLSPLVVFFLLLKEMQRRSLSLPSFLLLYFFFFTREINAEQRFPSPLAPSLLAVFSYCGKKFKGEVSQPSRSVPFSRILLNTGNMTAEFLPSNTGVNKLWSPKHNLEGLKMWTSVSCSESLTHREQGATVYN